MRVIAIVNQKGGCGKTTSAINIAGVFARLGQPTLLIDLDPQSHCAAGLAIPEQRIDHHIGDAMLTEPSAPLDRPRLVWRVSRGLDLVPSAMKLAGLEAARGGLADKPDRDHRLASVIERLSRSESDDAEAARRYEWVVIDCPPSIGLLTFNALRAATEVLIPVETGYFALKGASKQINTIRTLARRLGGATPYRVLATMHDPTQPLARTILGEIGQRFPGAVAPIVIRHDPKLREAASLGQPVVEYAPDSTGAADYGRLGAWLIDTPPSRHPEAHAMDTALILEPRPRNGTEPERADAHGEATRAAAQPAPAAPIASEDPVLSRAAELAARVRQLIHKSETFQSRQSMDQSVRHDATPVSAEGAEGAPTEPRVESPEPPARRAVRFVCAADRSARVCLSGEFNGWSDTATPMHWNELTRVHEAWVVLPTGRTRYRFVVNGEHRHDADNPERDERTADDVHSVVVVRPDAPGMISASHRAGAADTAYSS